MLRLVLASQSPRRQELLKAAGFDFTVDPVKVSEIIDENLTPEAAVSAIASKKMSAALHSPKYMKVKGFLLLVADTMVVLDERLLGKPGDDIQASNFLTLLSGKMHRVITAIGLAESAGGKSVYHVETSFVTFRKLTAQEISDYVRSGEPRDKAGAYGIQGAAGKFISKIEGSFSNVVGLPTESLQKILRENGWDVGRK